MLAKRDEPGAGRLVGLAHLLVLGRRAVEGQALTRSWRLGHALVEQCHGAVVVAGLTPAAVKVGLARVLRIRQLFARYAST